MVLRLCLFYLLELAECWDFQQFCKNDWIARRFSKNLICYLWFRKAKQVEIQIRRQARNQFKICFKETEHESPGFGPRLDFAKRTDKRFPTGTFGEYRINGMLGTLSIETADKVSLFFGTNLDNVYWTWHNTQVTKICNCYNEFLMSVRKENLQFSWMNGSFSHKKIFSEFCFIKNRFLWATRLRRWARQVEIVWITLKIVHTTWTESKDLNKGL